MSTAAHLVPSAWRSQLFWSQLDDFLVERSGAINIRGERDKGVLRPDPNLSKAKPATVGAVGGFDSEVSELLR